MVPLTYCGTGLLRTWGDERINTKRKLKFQLDI